MIIDRKYTIQIENGHGGWAYHMASEWRDRQAAEAIMTQAIGHSTAFGRQMRIVTITYEVDD